MGRDGAQRGVGGHETRAGDGTIFIGEATLAGVGRREREREIWPVGVMMGERGVEDVVGRVVGACRGGDVLGIDDGARLARGRRPARLCVVGHREGS